MNEISNGKLFSLLAETSQGTNEEIQNAYEDFIAQVTNFNQSELNLSEAFRTLSLSRIEFGALGALPFYGQGKKCA